TGGSTAIGCCAATSIGWSVEGVAVASAAAVIGGIAPASTQAAPASNASNRAFTMTPRICDFLSRLPDRQIRIRRPPSRRRDHRNGPREPRAPDAAPAERLAAALPACCAADAPRPCVLPARRLAAALPACCAADDPTPRLYAAPRPCVLPARAASRAGGERALPHPDLAAVQPARVSGSSAPVPRSRSAASARRSVPGPSARDLRAPCSGPWSPATRRAASPRAGRPHPHLSAPSALQYHLCSVPCQNASRGAGLGRPRQRARLPRVCVPPPEQSF